MMVTELEYRKLVSMARRMCAAYRLNCDPEDLAGDTVVACADKAEQFDPERGAKLQWMKARMRKLAGLRQEQQCTELCIPHEVKSDLVWHSDPDALDALDGVMSSLPERDRAVLTCRYIDGLTVEQTAQRLGLTRDQVRVTKRRLDRLAVQRGQT